MWEFPETLFIDIGQYIEKLINWMLVHMSGFFDAVTNIILWILLRVQDGLSFIPWWVYIALVFVAGWRLGNWRKGFSYAFMLFLVGGFGLWELMIYTLSTVFVSVFIALLVGIPLGITMAKSQRLGNVLKPVLDAMQTMPSMVYLIPAAMLFGLGMVPAVFATTIYALPPIVRLTYLGLMNVDKEIKEAGQSFGSTGWQLLKKVELPQALPTIMTGINQTTMMAMSMVVLCSMIAARGIGEEVLTAINRLQIGRGFNAGFAIVFIAIIFDRILQGAANRFKTSE